MPNVTQVVDNTGRFPVTPLLWNMGGGEKECVPCIIQKLKTKYTIHTPIHTNKGLSYEQTY